MGENIKEESSCIFLYRSPPSNFANVSAGLEKPISRAFMTLLYKSIIFFFQESSLPGLGKNLKLYVIISVFSKHRETSSFFFLITMKSLLEF